MTRTHIIHVKLNGQSIMLTFTKHIKIMQTINILFHNYNSVNVHKPSSRAYYTNKYNILKLKDQNTTFTVGSSMTNLYKVQVEIPIVDQSSAMSDIHSCADLDPYPMTSET